ncbi:Dihydrofolate reductase [Rickettsiales endosymbiont of Paramecium tredecaurelia]|uniref:dihydrofolate reductase n=1 Tax=Candidatus Sarmatiella mevalonica TaxID=2770581 RepID=UPI001920FE30|nr:dihydrofolate reductase [Candidatus Sarmatiella mevalonica]MBL3284439.1 Dihydrofolate reductase [Candidatus Sarmatiella mevalonica]
MLHDLLSSHQLIIRDLRAALSALRPGIVGIMAATEEGVVGLGSSIPWRYPLELDYFLQITHGARVIMGRKTFESMPSSFFPARRTIVLSMRSNLGVGKLRLKQDDKSTIVFCRDIASCIALTQNRHESVLRAHLPEQVFMIGGAEVCNMFLQKNLLSAFLLTKIHKHYNGDALLDLEHLYGWHLASNYVFDEYTISLLLNPLAK